MEKDRMRRCKEVPAALFLQYRYVGISGAGWNNFSAPSYPMPKRKYLKASPPPVVEEPVWQLPGEEAHEEVCPLCGRPLAEPMNRHHLVPLSRGGRGTTTLLMHKICHDKIHSVLTEAELQRYYHTAERLQAHEDIAAFIRWVQKKEPQFYDRSVRKSAE